MLTTVPVVDVAPALGRSPSGLREVASAVGRACEEIGFFTMIGHGIDPALVEDMARVSREFFDLPLAEKLEVRRPRPEQSRGYIGMGEENLSYSLDQAGYDLKELFAIGPVDVPDDPYYTGPAGYPAFAPNVWPRRPERFRRVWTAYYRALEGLASRTMELCAVALGLPPDHFHPFFDRHMSGVRVNHYPDQPEAPGTGQLRAGAHTDYGAVTILESENAPGGLQVRNRLDRWVDVVAGPDAFVVNIGDLMQRWTNDRWRSTLHRVVNPPRDRALGSRRQSIVYFCQPNYDAVITCLPTCAGPGRPARYEPVTSGEHRLRKFLKGVGASETRA